MATNMGFKYRENPKISKLNAKYNGKSIDRQIKICLKRKS